mgnify:CR=1 FL=1
MLDEKSIIGLPDFELVKVHSEHPILKMEIRYSPEEICPHCSSNLLRKKDFFLRRLRHESWGTRSTYVLVHCYKYHCASCGKYFNSRFPGILPYQRATEFFKKEVVEKHHNGISQQALSKLAKIGNATIERWYHKSQVVKVKELSERVCPRVMGIDEHFFTRKKGFATTFVDLTKNKVFDLALGRSEDSLSGYLNKLKGKDNVKVMLMDLSETYRSIASKYFPKALVVADRFHVVRMINLAFIKVWHLLDEDSKWNRGLMSLMRRHDYNLREDQATNLRRYLKSIPGLESIYDFKQELTKMMLTKSVTHPVARKMIPRFLEMIEMLKGIGFDILQKLGRTLDSWKEEIARMWRFTKTNSITEGLHTKMEMISRRAFGFRNFENYKLRVKVLCGY